MKKTDLSQSATLNTTYKKIQSKESWASSFTTWQNFFGKKVVLTHICFDILHSGHIEYLAKAKDLGYALIVAINSDASLKEFSKNNTPPLLNEYSRSMLLASLHFVDGVVIFDEATPSDLINFLKPNILVQSTNYDLNETNPKSEKYIPGLDKTRENGGEVIIIDLFEDISSILTREEMKKNSLEFTEKKLTYSNVIAAV